MKWIKMIQKLSLFQWIVLLICIITCSVGMYGVTVYSSLNNVFKEMNYGAITRGSNILNLPEISKALDSNIKIKDPEWIRSLPLNKTNLDTDEQISVIVGRKNVFILEFRKQLSENTFLYITYTYIDSVLIGDVEIANSDISLTYAKEFYRIMKSENGEQNLKESLDRTYWFSSSKGLPTLQLTKPNEILGYLKSYGIDSDWIKEKGDSMLYDVVLNRWFKHGSSRYSQNNLGNLRMIPDELFK